MKILTLCSRFHNNTAYLGVEPISSVKTATVHRCRDICLGQYPRCLAEKPLAKGDIINVIEIVTDCHEFDAIPPLSHKFTTSSDKVSRAKRASNFGNPIKRTGFWTHWTKCHNNTKYQFRSQPCEYGRLIQKRHCPNKETSGIPATLHSSPFQPYPPQPYKHPDEKSLEYKQRLAEHARQLQKSRQNCCKRQEWYREHVKQNSITFCRHPCPPSIVIPDSINDEQALEQLPDSQYTFLEEPTNRYQEFSEGESEIIMLPNSVPSQLAPETVGQEYSVAQRQLSNSKDEVGLHFPHKAQPIRTQKTGSVDRLTIDERVRTYEEEYFHEMQSRLSEKTDQTSGSVLPNNERKHQPITSDDYYQHEQQQNDDYYQQQMHTEDYTQQDELSDEPSTYPENTYPEQGAHEEHTTSGNDNLEKSELDGADYEYDYYNHEEIPTTADKELIIDQQTKNQFFQQRNDSHDTRNLTSINKQRALQSATGTTAAFGNTIQEPPSPTTRKRDFCSPTS
uniref:Uncharacterized protein n=1 Tax=Setaria digitata TaxID=48799 RepID=A0A915Q730_9BILA